MERQYKFELKNVNTSYKHSSNACKAKIFKIKFYPPRTNPERKIFKKQTRTHTTNTKVSHSLNIKTTSSLHTSPK